MERTVAAENSGESRVLQASPGRLMRDDEAAVAPAIPDR